MNICFSRPTRMSSACNFDEHANSYCESCLRPHAEKYRDAGGFSHENKIFFADVIGEREGGEEGRGDRTRRCVGFIGFQPPDFCRFCYNGRNSIDIVSLRFIGIR